MSEQQGPTGFPTLPNPNPQDPKALAALIACGAANSCSLLLANDPDGDRLAVATQTPDAQTRVFTGDEIGVLLAADLLAHPTEEGRRCVVASLVSTGLIADIATQYGAQHIETLTGQMDCARRPRGRTIGGDLRHGL